MLKKVIFDCDNTMGIEGYPMDDALAFLYVLGNRDKVDLLGFTCTFAFLLLGKWMGRVLFANELAGTFIVTLGWMCPFLYLSTTLSSVLNGLGKTTITFVLNIIGLAIRIASVVWGIPVFGIKAYLWGTLISQIVMATSSIAILGKKT